MNSLDEQYGYDANFISDVWESLKCGVCHLVMRQPVQIMSCGHRFCKACFERLQGYSTHLNTQLRCPIDRDQIDVDKVFDDTAVSRDIGNLQVTCSHVAFGCSWKGDLRNLRDHEKECQHQINQNMQNRNQNANTENMNLVAELLRRVQSCENALSGEEKDLALMKYDIMEMKKKYDDKENEVTALKTLNEDIRREMGESKKVNEKIEEHYRREIEILEKGNEKLETRLQSLETLTKGETEIMNGKLELLETRIMANEITVMGYKEVLASKEQLESLKAVITNQIKVFEKDIAKLPTPPVQALTNIDNFKADITNRIESLETQTKVNETMLKEHKELFGSKEQHEKFKAITNQIELLETQIKTIETTVREHDESFGSKDQHDNFKADITNRIKSLETQIEANKTTLKENKELFVFKEELKTLKEDITNKFSIHELSKFETRFDSIEKLHTDFRKDMIHHLKNIENLMFCHEQYCKGKNLQIKWVMTNFQKKYDSGKCIYSPIFYTSLEGYNFKFLVKWSDDDKENLGLYLLICLNEDTPAEQDGEGKYMLNPFRIEYDLEIHHKDGSSKVYSITFAGLDQLRESCFTIPPNKNEASTWCGTSTMLHKSNWNDCVINDMMFITCTFRTC